MPRVAVRNPGGSLAFNGTSTFVSFGSPSALNLQTQSHSFYFRPIPNSTDTIYTSNLSAGSGFEIRYYPTGQFVIVQSGVVVLMNNSVKVIPKERWNHVVITYNNVTAYIALYINGVLFDAGTSTAVTFTNNDVYIGKKTGFLKSFISNYRIFSQELSATEIKTLYLNNINPYTPKASWAFDEMMGTSIADTSGNNITGTITAGTWSTDRPFANRTSVQNINASLAIPAGSTRVVSNAVVPFTATGMTYTFEFLNVIDGAGGVPRIFQHPAGIGVGIGNLAGAGGIAQNRIGIEAWSMFGDKIKNGVWYTGCAVYDGLGNVFFYLNGQTAIPSGAITGRNIPTTPALIYIGVDSTLGDSSNIKIRNFRVFNIPFTQAQAETIHYRKTFPVGNLVLEYKMNEGAGSIVYDTSGNGYNATITGATWSSDTPSKARKIVGGNMIPNGDFSYVPVVNVATTTTARFIDGTAGGATTNDLFGWGQNSNASVALLFDTTTTLFNKPTFKISTTGVSSYALATQAINRTAPNILKYGVRLLPNTSYTLSFYQKTNYISGSSSQGSRMSVYEWDASPGLTASNATSFVTTTTDWTQRTLTFTTASTTRMITLEFGVEGSGGTGTLIMDAWFANISLVPTVNTTRNSIS